MSVAAPQREPVNRWLVLVLVCFAQFMVILDATIVNVALPSIQSDLDFSAADLQWVINSYTLIFGGFLLLGGRAGDLLGRKRIFLAGVALFSVASLLNGLATRPRCSSPRAALQGLGAALVSPAALSIITTTFAEGPERTKALGVWSAIAAGGAAVRPAARRHPHRALSWEWIFFVNVPVGIAAFAALAALRAGVARAEHRPGSFDIAGAVTVTAGPDRARLRDRQGASRRLGLGAHARPVAAALALLGAFVVIERRSQAPLIRLGIFRVRSLAGANIVMLLVAAGLFAMFFFASLYVQQVLGYTPLEAGLAFLPVTRRDRGRRRRSRSS